MLSLMLAATFAWQTAVWSGSTFSGLLVVPLRELLNVLVTTFVFTIFGLAAFAVAFLIMGKVMPFSVRKELEEDHNTALAIVMGAVIIGIALIIAAAVQG